MTRRTRLAIIDYWLSKQALYWRRYARLLLLILSFAVIPLQICFAADTKSEQKPVSLVSLVSKESKPAVATVKAGFPVKAAKKEAVKKEMPGTTKKNKPELPDADPLDDKAEGVVKFLQGTVSARNNFGLAVVYGVDEKQTELELWSNYNKATKLVGYSNYSAIEEGDKVEIKYKQLSAKEANNKKILKEVSLLQKKPKEAPDVPQDVPDSSIKQGSAAPTVKL